uniref:DUF4435 domain-containing protein n=1 Tax=Candidatus Kentrum sp. TC TaxID=2126339 RepID=A0A450YEA6_9GAMM|nr:MAG: hypothetical protein BECKTC1821E_GA0114239_100585 [Candidatus Kentron sp. TC]
MDFRHDGPNVVLTEGKDDCHVILALCEHYGIPERFGFYDCGSDEKVLKKMSALIAGSQPVETICVVLDADNPNLHGKWNSIRSRLQERNYSIPNIPRREGTILQANNNPTIGIWLMPDNNLNGMLEDFCRQLAMPDAIGYAESCVHQAKRDGYATFTDSHESKAVIHTFLAWQNRPGMPLGQAITACSLSPNQPIAEKFVVFLRYLFETRI